MDRMKIIRILSLVVCAILFTNCQKAQQAGDVSFAKNAFESLARGDSAAATKVDWETLVVEVPAVGSAPIRANVGQEYVALQTDADRQTFINGFITQFSSSFRQSGASPEGLSNWRVTHHDTTRTEVTANSANGFLKITVNHRDGTDRISAIQVLK